MPSQYQTYVTQIQNNLAVEDVVISMLDKFSTVASEMSQIALIGLQEKKSKSNLNTLIQQTFSVNKRHANGAIAFVTGEVSSTEQCHKRHLEVLKAKVKGCKDIITSLEKRLKEHRKYIKKVETYNKSIKTTGKTKKLTVKPEFDLACPINGKQHGKTYWQLAKFKFHQKKRQLAMFQSRLSAAKKRGVVVNQGKLGQISFVGSTGEKGSNQICQFQPGVIPSLKIRVPYFLESEFGETVELPLNKFNERGRDAILAAWAKNEALTYVFSKNKYGKWVVAITCNVYFKTNSNDRSEGVLGLDINPGSIGWCATNKHSNPVAFGQVKLDLHSCSKEQTTARLADAVTEITTRALAQNKPIAIEKLDFSEKKKNMKPGRKYRRMLSGFAYAKFVELLKSRALKLGIRVIEVSPKFSSQIGVSKYMKRYGMGSDSAAALVISRRGMGIYLEKLPARYALQSELKTQPRKHVFAHWQSFSGHYKLVRTRNDWFGETILTGCQSNSSHDTGNTVIEATVKGISKAQVKRSNQLCSVSWV